MVRMQEASARSKARKIIVHAVASREKGRSPKMQK